MSANSAIATIDAPPPWREGHALVLEPGSLFRQLMTSTLRRESGAYVFAVGRQDEALDVIRNESPSLVVMDWSPFDETGQEMKLVRALREHENPFVQQIPLLVTSNRARRRDILHARNMGATDYVLKPASPKRVIGRADEAEMNPQPFVKATRYRGPDRRRRPRDVQGDRFKRGADVRAGLVDPLAAARNGALAMAEEVAAFGCPLTRRVVVSLKRYLEEIDVFTERENEVVEIHRAALVQLERARFEGGAGTAVVTGLEQVVANRLGRR